MHHSQAYATYAIQVLPISDAVVQTAGQTREQSAQSTGASDGMAEEGHWETPSLEMQSVVPGIIHMHLQLVLEK